MKLETMASNVQTSYAEIC